MHACLCISEIAQNIADHADGGLVNLALSCQFFYEPALNAIWRDVPSLGPVLLCLSPAVSFSIEGRTLSFQRRPSAAESRRFEHHAGRIRRLTVSFVDLYHGYGVAESCLRTLADLYSRTAAFPNLHSLTVLGGHQIGHGFASFKQSPLQELAIQKRNDGDSLNIAELTASVSATLLYFRWSSQAERTGHASEIPEFEQAISSFSTIRALHVFMTYSPAGLHHLSSLPNLVSLTICVAELDYANIMRELAQPFRTLRHLKVTYGLEEISYLVSILHIVSPLYLESLEIRFAAHTVDHGLTPDVFYAMFPIVPKFKDLRHLSIGMIYHDDPIWIDWTADGSVLESIFDLHSLESLDLADVPLRLTANNMKDIALAFPRLRKLHLSSNCSFYPVDVPACITVAVEDLSCFARHCPQMRELAITNTFVPIYTSQVPTPTPLPTESNLRELCLGQSHITDPQRVAAFCADVYPFAQITSNHIGCDEHGECWAKIVSSIDNMKNRMVVSRMLEERAAASRRTYHNVGVQVRPGDRDA